MADPKLTDAQVAALAGAEEAESRDITYVFCDTGAVEAEHIRALALEVHQSRQRRCGNCKYWESWAIEEGGMCRSGGPVYDWVLSTWSCADFTAKEPA